jgi:DNA-binding transcriptional regulator YiaG
MPNIASVLKDEVLRLARKEVRKEVETLKKATAQFRTSIAALKKQMADLERQQTRLGKQSAKVVTPVAEGEATTRFRFRAKRFAAQRQKLGISAGDMGTLLGVTAQTVYNWEAEKSRPRQQQLAAIAVVRSLGKREIKARLAAKPD